MANSHPEETNQEGTIQNNNVCDKIQIMNISQNLYMLAIKILMMGLILLIKGHNSAFLFCDRVSFLDSISPVGSNHLWITLRNLSFARAKYVFSGISI